MPADEPLCAVLLAAGRAERYGRAKLGESLTDGESVLARSLRGLLDPASGVEGGVWVVGRRAELRPWLGALGAAAAVHLVEVAGDGGQGDSLAAGVRSLPVGAATLVALGDQPLAAPRATAAVIAAYRQGRPAVTAAIARRGGLAMPPAVFGPSWRAALEGLSGDRGARALVASAADVVGVELGDGEWALDVDRPEDLDIVRAACGASTPRRTGALAE